MRSWLWIGLVVMLGACVPGFLQRQQQDTGGTARTWAVQVVQVRVDPVRGQADVVVQGVLPNPCLAFSEMQVYQNGPTFTVQLNTQPLPGTPCPDRPTPFEVSVPLDLGDLPPGTYQVVVGSVVQTFQWPGPAQGPTGAAPATTPQPQPTLPAGTQAPGSSTGRIVGEAWMDRCTFPTGGTATPGPGCARYDQGYASDGVRQPDEPALAGLKVRLAQGACPGTPMLETTTDVQGRFAFDVPPGTYCVSITETEPSNQIVLGEGMWVRPGLRQGQTTVTVNPGQEVQVAFAWFAGATELLAPEATPKACENRARFVEETIPDGSEIPPGTTFTKTWTLENTGTCTWTTEYAVVHVEGPTMGAETRIPLPNPVEPGQRVTISVDFTAPDAPGTYRSTWMLEDDQGNRFGPGSGENQGFWVEITVPTSGETLNPGEPTRRDTMDNPRLWFLLDEPQARFEMRDGQLIMYGLEPGSFDYWGLSAHPALKDAYLEGDFITGPECRDRDRYGFIVRAPEPAYGIVVEFSCAGEFRVYRWDGSYTGLQEWRKASAIRSGPNQKNTLGVWMEGSTIKVYANRILIGQVEDDAFLQGRFGLVVAAGATAGFQVAVDEVRYWQPLP